MSISGPNVRDFTDPERRLAVNIDSSLLYEQMVALYAFASDGGGEVIHEMGDELAAAVENAHPGLGAEIRSMSECELGLTLVGVARNLDGERTAANLISRLKAAGALEFRKLLMANCGVKVSKGYDERLIEGAAYGDLDAVKQILGSNDRARSLEGLLIREPESMLEAVISVVERFSEAVAPLLRPRQHILDREAVNAGAMAKQMRSDRLVEQLTNGVTFVMQPDVSEVVLIPSIVVRPWVVITEHHSVRIFVYAVSDDVLTADPDAPPSFLVDTYKALGDENRLRLLGVLAEGEVGLKDLAARVGLAKSTAHHHLRILRSAGLVRVLVSDDDKRYAIRRDAVDGSAEILREFLDSREQQTITKGDET